MAYETGIPTDQEDFIDKLQTFAVANGWTVDLYDATRDICLVRKAGIYVQFEWDNSTGIAVHQSLGHYQEAASGVINVGGTGYTVNDKVTVSGGTSDTAAVFNVDSVSGGVPTAISVDTSGEYFTLPSNPAATTGGTGTGLTIDVTWQYKDGGSHQDDSGNGEDGAGPYDTQRRMHNIGNSGFQQYYFFSSNEDGADYIIAVLEHSAGVYSTVAFGEIVKFGDWTGGEWCGATVYDTSLGPQDARHNYVVDGGAQTPADAATMHIEGFPNEDAATKWGVCFNTTNPGTDTAGEVRMMLVCGARDNFLADVIQGIESNPNNGYIPMSPYLCWARETGASTRVRFLGRIPHMRDVNGSNLVPAEEFTIGGSETWKVFPYTSKASSGTPHSGNGFFAVRKIV